MTTHTPRPKSRRLRLLAIAAGAISALALIPSAASAAPAQSATNAWLGYQPPTAGPFIFGGFSTEKKACEHRTIDVFRSTDEMNWDYGWRTQVVDGPNPGTTIYLSNADRGYYYVLSARRETVRNKAGKKILCQPDQSESIYAN